MKKILGLVVMLGLLTLPVNATDNSSDNITIPNTFSSGTNISSSQMNDNFNYLINIIDNLSGKIRNLESRIYNLENPYTVITWLDNGETNCLNEGFSNVSSSICESVVNELTQLSYNGKTCITAPEKTCIKTPDGWKFNECGVEGGVLNMTEYPEMICDQIKHH